MTSVTCRALLCARSPGSLTRGFAPGRNNLPPSAGHSAPGPRLSHRYCSPLRRDTSPLGSLWGQEAPRHRRYRHRHLVQSTNGRGNQQRPALNDPLLVVTECPVVGPRPIPTIVMSPDCDRTKQEPGEALVHIHIYSTCMSHTSELRTHVHTPDALRHITSTHTYVTHCMYTHGHTPMLHTLYTRIHHTTSFHSTYKHTAYVCTMCVQTRATHTYILLHAFAYTMPAAFKGVRPRCADT